MNRSSMKNNDYQSPIQGGFEDIDGDGSGGSSSTSLDQEEVFRAMSKAAGFRSQSSDESSRSWGSDKSSSTVEVDEEDRNAAHWGVRKKRTKKGIKRSDRDRARQAAIALSKLNCNAVSTSNKPHNSASFVDSASATKNFLASTNLVNDTNESATAQRKGPDPPSTADYPNIGDIAEEFTRHLLAAGDAPKEDFAELCQQRAQELQADDQIDGAPKIPLENREFRTGKVLINGKRVRERHYNQERKRIVAIEKCCIPYICDNGTGTWDMDSHFQWPSSVAHNSERKHTILRLFFAKFTELNRADNRASSSSPPC